MAFTNDEIAQIIEEFFKTVGARQYIGARYVPIFGRKDEDSIEWDGGIGTYEPLTIVLYQGNSYTSRQFVPVGVEISNNEFWANTGNYNAQVEQYRQAVVSLGEDVTSLGEDVDNLQDELNDVKDDIDNLLPKSSFSEENTVEDTINNTKDDLLNTIDITENNLLDAIAKNFATENIGNYNMSFLGRIFDRDKTIPQGFCIISNDTCLAAMTSNDSNTSYIYKINFISGVVVNKYEGPFSHANSLCYNPNEDVVYITPCYDYENSATPVNFFYEVSPSNMAIIKTHSFSSEIAPHSICYDKITDKFYLVSEDSNYTLYEINMTDDSLREIGHIKDIITEIKFKGSGYNDLGSYNGIFYYVFGNTTGSGIIAFDGNMSILNIFTPNQNVWIYSILEIQSIDFTNDGDVILFSLAGGRSITGFRFGVFSFFNYAGNKLGKYIFPENAPITLLRVSQTSNDPNGNGIRPTGESASPFYFLQEAILALTTCDRYSYIQLDSDIDIVEEIREYVKNTICITLNNHTINIYNTFKFLFGRVLLSNGTLKLTTSSPRPNFERCDLFMSNMYVDGSDGSQSYPMLLDTCTCMFDVFDAVNNNNVHRVAASNSVIYQTATGDAVTMTDALYYNRSV